MWFEFPTPSVLSHFHIWVSIMMTFLYHVGKKAKICYGDRVGPIMKNIHPGAIYNLMGFGCGNHSRVLEKYNRDSILEIENVTSQTMG